MAVIAEKDLPDLRKPFPDISNQYATVDVKAKSDPIPMDELLQALPLCVTRQQIDDLTVQFSQLCSSIVNCDKLVNRLYEVDNMELVPLYSRMVATMSTCMHDISRDLLTDLIFEIHELIPKKGRDKVERKLIIIKFIGELCTYEVAPPKMVLNVLKICMLDHIENLKTAELLVETCGEILLWEEDTAEDMKLILVEMKRLESVTLQRKQLNEEEKQKDVLNEAEKERERKAKELLVEVKDAAQELESLREEVQKREDRIEQARLMVQRMREEEMEEEARLDQAMARHKGRLGELDRVLRDIEHLTKKMDL